MKILLLINTALILAIFGILVFGFFKHYKKENINRVTNWLSLISLGYFILFLFSILWLGGFLNYNPLDFNFIYSFVILFQTLLFFKVYHSLKKQKTNFYLFIFYLISLALASFAFFSILYMPIFFLIISFLIILIILVNFALLSEISNRAVYAGIFYAGVSLILSFLLFFNIGEPFLFNLISNLFFIYFIFLFLKDIGKRNIPYEQKGFYKKESFIFLFIRYFVFVIVLINIVLISTIGVHELSHVLMAKSYGCEARTILYENGQYPYSEIICDNLSGKIPIALSGPLIPIAIALLLFIFGGTFMKPVSFLIIGFNLLASYKDFQGVGISNNIVIASSIIGVIFLFSGLVLLVKLRIKNNFYEFS